MIETEQTVLVDANIDTVWNYAKDMERWASIMPGYQQCEIIDDDNSLWILKVGVGAMVRTVKVEVKVEQWAGPEHVDFTFALKGDPVQGGGTYNARAISADQTEVVLHVRVEGSGPMAPMWEALGAPVLPKFARGFALELKDKIEAQVRAGGAPGSPEFAPAPDTSTGPQASAPSLLARIRQWLGRLWRDKQGG